MNLEVIREHLVMMVTIYAGVPTSLAILLANHAIQTEILPDLSMIDSEELMKEFLEQAQATLPILEERFENQLGGRNLTDQDLLDLHARHVFCGIRPWC